MRCPPRGGISPRVRSPDPVRIPAPRLPAEEVLAALRAEGPVFHGDVGRGWSVVGPLVDEGAVSAADWAQRARDALQRPGLPSCTPAVGSAFQPGRVGWFGYEAGPWFAPVAAAAGATPLPTAWLGRCDAAYVLAPDGSATVVGWPDDAATLAARLARGVPPLGPVSTPSGRHVPRDDRQRFMEGVRRIRAHLRAGDCYQVNLARRVDVDSPGDPLDAWRRLRAWNPARRAVFVETPHGAVVSNSPELLLAVQGGRALSVPIKGTAPRGGPVEPLLRSPKERAELTMIADLVRADLGRVAAPGSVEAGPRRVGPVGHVWHAMQRVSCALAEGRDAADAFAAVFPAGSVTGAPRIRATEVIRALEDGPRGVYCGAIGWFGAGGSAWWNVAIRTISFGPRGAAEPRASFHVGAGIVLGSDPAREYDETALKAQRMLEALC
jgi:para-aminobenzoate synthetase component 1